MDNPVPARKGGGVGGMKVPIPCRQSESWLKFQSPPNGIETGMERRYGRDEVLVKRCEAAPHFKCRCVDGPRAWVKVAKRLSTSM